MPDDSRIPGGNAEEMPLDGSVLSTVKIGGPGHATGWSPQPPSGGDACPILFLPQQTMEPFSLSPQAWSIDEARDMNRSS